MVPSLRLGIVGASIRQLAAPATNRVASRLYRDTYVRTMKAQATATGLDRKCGLGLQVSFNRVQPGRYLDTAISSSAAPSLGNSAATESSITVKRGRPLGNFARLVNTMRSSTGTSCATALTLAMRS